MSHIYQINENVKNLPENSAQSQSIMHHNINNKEIKPEQITIQLHSKDQHYLSLVTSLYPNRPNRHEISFEKTFLLEHTTSLHRQLQNLLEFAFSIKPRQKNQSIQSTKGLYLASVNEVNVLSFLKSQHVPSWDILMESFQRHTQDNDDLQKFLKQVISCSTRQLALQLITIVLDAWAEFRTFDFKFVQKKEILRRANDWGKKTCLEYFQNTNFGLLNCKIFAVQNPQDVDLSRQKFSNIVRFLASTVLLIMSGFFQNPYFDASFSYQEQADVDHYKRCFSQAFISDFFSDFEDNSFEESSLSGRRRQRNR